MSSLDERNLPQIAEGFEDARLDRGTSVLRIVRF